MSAEYSQQPPRDVAAERAVLGAILSNPTALHYVGPMLRPEHFADDRLRMIFSAITRIAATGGAIDPLCVRSELGADLSRVGGVSFVTGLLDRCPDVANVEQYARLVINAAGLREIIRAGSSAIRAAFEAGGNAIEVAAELSASLETFGTPIETASRGIGDVAATVRARADQRLAEGKDAGIRTGFDALDRLTGGFRRKALGIIGARTSHGKTAAALNLALGAVIADPSAQVAVYSLEMSDEAVTNSLRSRVGQIPLPRLHDWATLTETDRARVIEIDSYLWEFNRRFFFNDRLRDVNEICSDARMLKRTQGLDAIFVDYLQLVDGFENERSRERVVNQVAWQLFDLAKKLDVAVIALSQVTPDRANSHGRLSIDDLRDSKAIGHHSRLVLLMNRPWQSHKDVSMNLQCETTIQIEKNSYGATGDLAFHFDGATQTFTEGNCPGAVGCRYARRAQQERTA